MTDKSRRFQRRPGGTRRSRRIRQEESETDNIPKDGDVTEQAGDELPEPDVAKVDETSEENLPDPDVVPAEDVAKVVDSKRRRRRSLRDDKPEGDVEVQKEEPESGAVAEPVVEEPQPAKQTQRRLRRSERETASVDPHKSTALSPWDILANTLPEGKPIVIVRISTDRWLVQSMDTYAEARASRVSGRLPRGFNNFILNPKFIDWRTDWGKKTPEEKRAWAEDEGLEWNRHDKEHVELMSLSAVVRKHLGIEKYKKEFRTRKARHEAKQLAQLGELDMGEESAEESV